MFKALRFLAFWRRFRMARVRIMRKRFNRDRLKRTLFKMYVNAKSHEEANQIMAVILEMVDE